MYRAIQSIQEKQSLNSIRLSERPQPILRTQHGHLHGSKPTIILEVDLLFRMLDTWTRYEHFIIVSRKLIKLCFICWNFSGVFRKSMAASQELHITHLEAAFFSLEVCPLPSI